MVPEPELVVAECWFRKLCLFHVTPGAWDTVIHILCSEEVGIPELGRLAKEVEARRQDGADCNEAQLFTTLKQPLTFPWPFPPSLMMNGEVEGTSHTPTLGLASGLGLVHGMAASTGPSFKMGLSAWPCPLCFCHCTKIASLGSCFLFSHMSPCGTDLSPTHREETNPLAQQLKAEFSLPPPSQA